MSSGIKRKKKIKERTRDVESIFVDARERERKKERFGDTLTRGDCHGERIAEDVRNERWKKERY